MTTDELVAVLQNRDSGDEKTTKQFIADSTLVKIELLAWLSSVCPSVRLSVTDELWLTGKV